MTRRALLRGIPVTLPVLKLRAVDAYSGPRPAKKDLPYLLHGDHLVETEVQQATESKSKEGQSFSVPGATSSARTPMAEPIFLLASDKIKPEQLGLFRFAVKEGRRQLIVGKKHKNDDEQKSFHLTVKQLDTDLYRLEAADSLEPGEYSLSAEGDNTAFCFEVF